MEEGKCLGEVENEVGLGGVFPWDCAEALLLPANPAAWMTLICCWPSSSALLEHCRNRAVGWSQPAGREEAWRLCEGVKGTVSQGLFTAVAGVLFLLSEVFCVCRWVGGWRKRGEDSMSCQLLLREPHSVSLCQLAHTSSLPPTTKAGFWQSDKTLLRRAA